MSERWVFLDTETTGMGVSEGHKIIEIGCVEVVDRKITGKTFDQRVNPGREIDEGARQVHGISIEELADEPVFADIAEEFLEFIKDAKVIIHNASFDLGFLNAELRTAGQPSVEDVCGDVTDSLKEAQKNHQGKSNSLNALCVRHGVDISERKLHGALLDAQLLAEVYLKMTAGQFALDLGQNATNRNAVNDNLASGGNRQPQPKVSDYSVKVVYATEPELTAHNKILKDIRTEE